MYTWYTLVMLKTKFINKRWHFGVWIHLSLLNLNFLSLHFLQERNNRLKKSRDLSASHTDLARWRDFRPRQRWRTETERSQRSRESSPLTSDSPHCKRLVRKLHISHIILQQYTTKCSLYRFQCFIALLKVCALRRGFVVGFFNQYISRNKRNTNIQRCVVCLWSFFVCACTVCKCVQISPF